MADAALKRKTSRAKWGTVRVDDAADIIGIPKTQARHYARWRDLGVACCDRSSTFMAKMLLCLFDACYVKRYE